MTRRLEERVTCEDTEGVLYDVEVFREIRRLDDGSQEIGHRTAYIVGDSPRPVKALDDENTFQTPEGSTLRRVRGAPKATEKTRERRRGWTKDIT